MATSTKTRSPETPATADPASQPFQQVSEEMMGHLGESSSAYLRGVISLNREMSEFINKRLQHDADLGQALGQCKGWKEVTELQQQWFVQASEEYAENARTIMEMTSQILNQTWAPLQRQQAKEFDAAKS